MNVIILTEGFNNTGFGHLTRCTAIYQAFEANGIIPKLIVNGDKNAESILGNLNFAILNWLHNTSLLFDHLNKQSIVVIDSYLADLKLYNELTLKVKNCVFIDDNLRLPYPSGILLNGTVGSESFEYPERDKREYLLGSKYIPLRTDFWHVPEKTINNNVAQILITAGGQDIRNITPEIQKVVNEKYPNVVKNVVVGTAFSNKDEIVKSKDENTSLYFQPDSEQMKSLMLKSDIAISAAGQTLYELARTGTPTIAIGVIENQLNNIKGWEKAGFINYAGWWNSAELSENILKEMEKLEQHEVRNSKSQIGISLVDGKGAFRLVEYLKEKLEHENTISNQ
ncbi:MAG: UDP-2,4-diacetamido-2,4,6-trideoxy-beta-L-altropyranose hydrolase [Ignavibacteria bacterium]|jgi:spore coat polysaccharide biosynthesis predicted glycosyltransferase SpsG|nr:UDP-2,4-diacetamido-2,4,6-trideoxy-beta-L-altropyranose hydrolase [Ignavibacteria bacterium]MCU7503724.1 UDP-2,4-diacetamido-2,4,6-trideoxy-beta-L-altropyranose hydrolase [Ignavibacteria bacterium]MCU7517630.1 UDP-2,4-diacetamido-2,4,6-trideoxy-beta-L-altropyranose hydrolase [Ignavibacteria bacterium]